MRLVVADKEALERSDRLFNKISKTLPDADKPFLRYFLFLAEGGKNRLDREASLGSVVASVSGDDSSNVIWSTPSGRSVLSKSRLRTIAEDLVRLQAGKKLASKSLSVAELVHRARTSEKVDYPKDFKQALRFLEKEMKKIEKDLFPGAPIEQVFSLAYENLMDVSPDFCGVWNKFDLAKGLKGRGWNIRADVGPRNAEHLEARSAQQDMALQLQSMLGSTLGRFRFREMAEARRGCVSLLYDDEEDASEGLEYHLWYEGPESSSSALDIVILEDGKEVARFSEDNEHLLEDLFGRVVSDSHSRWSKGVSAAFEDDVDTCLPKALGPDRSGWHQMLHQVYLATRDFLRHEVPFFPTKMFLLGERWNGDTIEYTMRGDRENTAVFVTGSLDLGGPPVLSLEATYEKNGKGWTTVSQFSMDNYEKTSDLVSDVQSHLARDLEAGIRRLDESPSTTDQILQRAITPDLLQ